MANASVQLMVRDVSGQFASASAPAPTPTPYHNNAPFDPLTDIIFGSILILFSIVATVGNTMVIFVFMKESILRTTTNYFLMSLAFSDLLVSIVVMPFGIIERFNYGRWLFGRDLCDIWHAVDVMACTASIMNLCCIAIERYQAVHDPIKYPLRPNKTRVYIGILIAWLCSAAISFPAIAWWRLTDTQKYAAQNNKTLSEVSIGDLSSEVCHFTDASEYLISSGMVSFYVPTTCMLFLYYKIYRTAISVSRSYATGERSVAVTHCGTDENLRCPGSLVLRVHRGKTSICSNIRHSTGQSPQLLANSCRSPPLCPYKHVPTDSTQRLQESPPSHGDHLMPDENRKEHHTSVSSQDSDVVGSSCNTMLAKTNIQSITLNTIVDIAGPGAQSTRLRVVKKLQGFVTLKQQFRRFAREQKAAKTLGLIIFLFIACWGPFFLCSFLLGLQQLNVIGIVIPEEQLPMVQMCVTWLGYANSCINCFAYPWAMRDFRRAIYKHVKVPLIKCLRLPILTLRHGTSSFAMAQRSTDRNVHGQTGLTGTGFKSTASMRVRKYTLANPVALATVETAVTAGWNGNLLAPECSSAASEHTSKEGVKLVVAAEEDADKQSHVCTGTAADQSERNLDSPPALMARNGSLSLQPVSADHDRNFAAEVATKLVTATAMPYSSADIPRRLLAEVMSMNASLV